MGVAALSTYQKVVGLKVFIIIHPSNNHLVNPKLDMTTKCFYLYNQLQISHTDTKKMHRNTTKTIQIGSKIYSEYPTANIKKAQRSNKKEKNE